MLENIPPFSLLRGTALTWGISVCSAVALTLFGYDQGVLVWPISLKTGEEGC
jgi:hypothetical protein